jgi:hypothetical protein
MVSTGTFTPGKYEAFGKTFTTRRQLNNEIQKINGETGQKIVEVGNDNSKVTKMAANVIPFETASTKEKTVAGPQSQSNEATAKMVNELLGRGNRATKDIRSQWPTNYRFVVNGEQWPIRRPRWRFKEVVNITWANIMQEVALQTDSKPSVEFNAVEPSDFQFTEILKQINDVNWTKSSATGHGWHRKVQNAIFQSKIYHVVHAEVSWNPELEHGLGDIDFKILDPYGCFWDPLAKDISEARWFIYAEPVPTAKLHQQFPEMKDFIKPDVSSLQQSGAGDGIDDHDVDLVGLNNMLSESQPGRNERDDQKFGGEPMTLKLRCWLKDDTVEEMKEEKDVGGEIKTEFVKKLKFPNGRYIEVANKVTLKDEENQYEDGMFPIAPLVNYDYGEYAGETEVQHMMGPQNIVNYVWSYILDTMKMSMNPQNIIAAQDQDIVKKLTNEPGLNVVVSNPANFRREPGMGIPAGMFNILDMALSLLDKVGGLQDVSRGTPQPGITSGLMLEGFVEAAQTRPRLKNRSVDEWLRQVGTLMAARYLQFYTAPRVFRVTNEQGFPEFVEFSIGQQEDGAKVARFAKKDQAGQLLQVPQEIPVKGLPDVKVESGSALPFARAQKTATALDLHGRGAITLQSLLESINWPNPDEEVQKVQEEQARIAEQQAAEGPPQ